MLYFVYCEQNSDWFAQTIAKFCVLVFVVNGDNFCYTLTINCITKYSTQYGMCSTLLYVS